MNKNPKSSSRKIANKYFRYKIIKTESIDYTSNHDSSVSSSKLSCKTLEQPKPSIKSKPFALGRNKNTAATPDPNFDYNIKIKTLFGKAPITNTKKILLSKEKFHGRSNENSSRSRFSSEKTTPKGMLRRNTLTYSKDPQPSTQESVIFYQNYLKKVTLQNQSKKRSNILNDLYSSFQNLVSYAP